MISLLDVVGLIVGVLAMFTGVFDVNYVLFGAGIMVSLIAISELIPRGKK